MSEQSGRGQRGMPPVVFITFVVVGALIGGALGALVGTMREDAYVASSTVLVTPLEGNPYSPEGNGDDLLNLETEAQLVRSDAVRRAVSDEVDDVPLDELDARVEVEVPPNTQILRITYRDPDEGQAVAAAQAFADSYLAHRVARSEAALERQNSDLGRQIRILSRELRDLSSRIQQQGNEAVRRVTRERVAALSEQVVQLQTERAQLRETSRDPGQVVNPAVEATRFPVPWWLIAVAAGVVVGAFAGAFAAVAVSSRRLRRTNSDPDEGVL